MTLQNTYLGAQLDGTSDQLMARLTYTIPITVPSDGWLVAIEAEFADDSTLVQLIISAGVYADDGGQPGTLIHPSQIRPADNPAVNTTVRWVTLPVGAWLTAGDYHLGVSFNAVTSPVLRKRTGGASGDGHTVSVGVGSLGDPDYSGATVTATTDTYSIRGVFVTEAATGNVDVGLVTETEVALPITSARAVDVGVSSEAETALPVTASKPIFMDVGLATESELANPITPVAAKIVDVGTAPETELAQPITASKVQRITVGQTSETELALGVTIIKPVSVDVGTVTEIELALGISPVVLVPGKLRTITCDIAAPSVMCSTASPAIACTIET